MQLPDLAPWMKTLLGVLLGAYVLELILRNAGMPVDALVWRPFGMGFQPWQPLTRFLVQGDGVLGVVIGLAVLAFALPALEQALDRAVWLRGLAAGAIGSSVLPLAVDAVGFGGGATVSGWGGSVLSIFLLFGLALPTAIVKLFFILDVKAGQLVWLALALVGFIFVLSPSLRSAEGLGAWLGVMGWWYGIGPGARRRTLKAKAAGLEREIRRFQVIEGGRADEPRRRAPNRPDDLVH
jgi:hypothetical protein